MVDLSVRPLLTLGPSAVRIFAMKLPTHLGAGSGPLPSLALHSLASDCLDVLLRCKSKQMHACSKFVSRTHSSSATTVCITKDCLLPSDMVGIISSLSLTAASISWPLSFRTVMY